MANTVHFTLGDNIGRELMKMAQEKLTVDLDPKNALSLITKCLSGIPESIALDILIGRKVIVVNADRETVNVIDRGAGHGDYPLVNPVAWTSRKNKEMRDRAQELLDTMDTVLKNVGGKSYELVGVDILSFMASYNAGDFKSIVDEVRRTPDIDRMVTAVKLSRDFLAEFYKFDNVVSFLAEHFQGDITVSYRLRRSVNDIVNRLALLDEGDRDNIKNFVGRTRSCDDEGLTKYLNANLEIEKTIKEGIKPVDITGGYDAGWLSPNGTFYGLNGMVANLLHIRIADALTRESVVPEDTGGLPADAWMGAHGWVKIHHDHVLFEGYLQASFRKELIPLTDAQVREIVRYGEACYNGRLRLGMKEVNCPVSLLETCDEAKRAVLFDYKGVGMED